MLAIIPAWSFTCNTKNYLSTNDTFFFVNLTIANSVLSIE